MELYLPINQTILNTHCGDCYAYYCYLYQAMEKQFISFSDSKITILTQLDRRRKLHARLYSEYEQTSFNRCAAKWNKDELLILDEETTLMPRKVWDRLYELLRKMPLRSRNSWCRFYLMMYFLCHYHHNDYNIAVSTLATMLKSDAGDICKKINFFIDAGMLRRIGMYCPADFRPYRYFIPAEYESKPFKK